MKATFNNIVNQLTKVLTDKVESAQYYSESEQYTGICGWCGIMSPESRPAYIKTFGKDTTEAAEDKAREIIAEKEAARQRTKYAQHAQEADRLEGVPAVGGFFWADNSGLKCDGGRGLFEELHALTCYTHATEKPARLCCVEQIIKVSEEDFARPDLADELVTRHNLQGFCRSEDVDDNDNTCYNDPEKLATFYTVGALVVSPSGKYYLIDSEGYSYARYIYVPIEWPEMFAAEVASVKAEEEARKAEEARQAANSTDTTDEAPAEGLKLVEIAEGVAVVGDSRTTYRNRKAIKSHGAIWNKTAQQWQATDPEAVARLRQWFGASATQTTEADTINENDREKALFVIFAACEIGRLKWHATGYYTYPDATAEDWGNIEAVAPEVVTAWREAGNPINRNECVRLCGEELTKEAEDAYTIARYRAKYCEDWRDELREIWAIYKDLTAIGNTTTDTDAQPEEQEQEQHAHNTDSEQPEPMEQPEQPNAEEVERATRFAALLTDVFTMFEELATAAQAGAQRAKEAATKQAEAEQLRADIAQMSAQVAKMAETLRAMSERLATLEAEANTDSHTDSTADTGTASDNEPQPEDQERPERGKDKPETLNMLRAAAEDVERLTEANEHTAALLAQLYVLAAIGLSVRSLIERAKTIEAAHRRGYLTPEEVADRHQISQETERRAALYLTPEEFRALYRHDPQTDSRAA